MHPDTTIPDEFARRREALLSALGPAVVVAAAAPTAIRNQTTEHAYRQDSDFYYLSGLDEPESVLVLTNCHPEHRYVIFVRPRDKEKETWEGRRVGVEGAVSQLRADIAFPISELAQKLPAYLTNVPRLLFDLGRDHRADEIVLAARGTVRRKQREGVLAPAELLDPREWIHPMRLRKSDVEVAAMEHAIAITAEAHRRARELARPGVYEHEIEAEILRVFRKNGARRYAYHPIVGSGPNATILHYHDNDRLMQEGDLLLIDAGVEWDFQSADVTRTFPISGRFTEPQRRLYELVLGAQKRAIGLIAPGRTIEDVHEEAVCLITMGLIELGFIEGPLDKALEAKSYKPFYMHRSSHWLGMDVHDVGAYFERHEGTIRPRPFEPGNVLTVEPGLYVSNDAEVPPEYRGIGIRIEDDVLVTEGSHRVLSAAIPKEVAELERS